MTQHGDEPAGAPERSGPGGLVRLRLDIGYDGSGFHGWARQPGLRSVQAELETVVRTVLRVPAQIPVRVAVAGRTDAGVHATGQVCHCDVPEQAWAGQAPGAGPPHVAALVRRRMNGLLPADLRVRRVDLAPEGFDARWSAAWRRYAYLVADDPADQDPRARGHVLWHPRRLDAGAMAAAVVPFLGEHDFAAFCRHRAGASTVRSIHEIGWQRLPGMVGSDPGQTLGVLAFGIRADAFCHSMVRALVGAFLAVGEGRWEVGHPAALLADAKRVPSIATAPAHGLTLVEVGYPTDLAEQARRARRWRGPQPPDPLRAT